MDPDVSAENVMQPNCTSHCIPPEMCTQILSYLPAKSLLRFRSVCRQWKSLIGNRNFASLHLSHYANNLMETRLLVFESHVDHHQLRSADSRARWFSGCPVTQQYRQTLEFDFPLLAKSLPQGNDLPIIAGQIDGLFLVQRERSRLCWDDFVLWNPSLRKNLSVPYPPSSSQQKFQDLFLGFDPSTHEYKVVRMAFHFLHAQPTITTEIFSLFSRSWRRSRKMSNVTRFTCGGSGKRICLGGFTYWVGHYPFLTVFPPDYETFVSFNMTTETSSYTLLPKLSCELDKRRIYLPVVVDGSSIGLLTSCHGTTEIWVLERDVGWSKRFKFDIMIMENLWLYLNKDGMLVWKSDGLLGTAIFACDLNTGKESVVSHYNRWWLFYMGSYCESLLLLN